MPAKSALPERLQAEVMELASAINVMVENFRKLQNPLVDSQEKVPQATEQLDKITRQTEAAAQQMLDMVEKITARETDLTEGLVELRSRLGANADHEYDDLIDTLIEKSTTNCNDAYAIMNALQFQDITSQQMNHAASMLEHIENKLNEITLVMRGEAADVDRRPQARVFDPHADLFEKKTKQKEIDNMFSEKP